MSFDVGQTIRDLRRQRNLTGEELGKLIGLSQSKISKIEGGGALKPIELKTMLDVLDAPKATRAQALAIIGLEEETSPRRFNGHWKFNTIYEIESQTTLLRTFVTSIMPALLQTSQYRQSILKSCELTGSQLRTALSEMFKRQELLWDKSRRFHFITTESALYSLRGDVDVQIGQLNKIDLHSRASNIRFGIIPYQVGLPTIEANTFVIYDERLVINSIGGSEISTQDEQEISDCIHAFGSLEKYADYGENARALIRKAINYFS